MVNGKNYCIALIQPERFVYVEAFREIMEMLQVDFAALGHQVPVLINRIPADDSRTILFGAHLLSPAETARLPTQTIIFNAEHLTPGNTRIPPHYQEMLARFEVWDFSLINVERIRRQLGNQCVSHFPLAYSPVMSRLIPEAEDIDVLFYGFINERRNKVLQALRDAGVKVTTLTGVFGAERDLLIARAKIVLNMHFDADAGFESVRVIPLLANRKAVVCEDATSDLPDGLRDAMRIAPYEQLASACLDLLAHPAEREALAMRGWRAVVENAQPSIAHLAARLGMAPVSRATAEQPTPGIMVAGSGRKPLPGCLNADINPANQPDWQVDLGHPLRFGVTADFGPYGGVILMPGMFDAIIAHHLLEHISDVATAMGNFLALLRDGGVLHIEVPYDLSYGAWQDPTHVRAFNERSWLYFTEWHDRLGWHEARFDLVSLAFLLSPIGQKMRAQQQSDEIILRTPRAVDSMRVALVRRRLVASSHS